MYFRIETARKMTWKRATQVVGWLGSLYPVNPHCVRFVTPAEVW
jgi:hypothetical protein